MQMINVKMRKTIPMFILVFTGYLCNNMGVATDTPTPSHLPPISHEDMQTPKPTSHEVTKAPKPTPHKVTQAPQSEAPPPQSSDVPVAAIVIPSVLLSVVVITVGCFVWKKSKRSSSRINSVPSGEPGVSLNKISTQENRSERPLGRE